MGSVLSTLEWFKAQRFKAKKNKILIERANYSLYNYLLVYCKKKRREL